MKRLILKGVDVELAIEEELDQGEMRVSRAVVRSMDGDVIVIEPADPAGCHNSAGLCDPHMVARELR